MTADRDIADSATAERERTADALFHAAIRLDRGQFEAATDRLQQAAAETDCGLCEATLRSAAGGVAFVASPIKRDGGSRLDHVYGQLVMMSRLVDPDDELDGSNTDSKTGSGERKDGDETAV